MSETGYADINGAQVYYEVAGTGQPLVLVHAGIADSRMWDGQFDYFARNYEAVRYDLRGYGKTEMVAGDYAHRRDLYELLKFLKIEREILVGCSMGGRTCIDFTLEHPDMVKALVLVGSDLSGFEDDGELPKQWDEMVAAYNAGDLERLSELEVQIWVDGAARTPEHVPAHIRNLVREMNLITLRNEALKLGSEQALEPPAIGRLGEIHVPTLVVVGDLDETSIVQIAGLLADGIAGAQRVEMRGMAHVPNMEQPSEFNQIVVEFLNRL